MQVRVLGSIAIRGEHEVNIGGPTQRRIIALLALRRREIVPVSALEDVTWPDGRPPRKSEQNLRTYVSRIRHGLGDGLAERLRTVAPGYTLDLGPGELDSEQLDRCLREGEAAAIEFRHADAVARARSGLSLWSGLPYGEFADEAWAVAEVERLKQVRIRLIELQAQSLLALGSVADAAQLVEPELAEYQLRESLREIHMRALHQEGRTVEALRSFQTFRSYVVDELGVEPSESLTQLDRMIASGDPVLQQRSASTIRGYTLHEQIGEGAFAIVYRGTQPGVDRSVAIKSIKSELANSPDFIRAFEAEAQTIARLEHPHIVPLYDFWREPSSAYLVMRWLPAGSLADALSSGPLDTDAGVRIMEQVGAALTTAHASGVVHRDVKPANIFLDEEGNGYLGDFGIAIETTNTFDPRAEFSRQTAVHSSPEQRNRQPVGPASDIYALGATALEVLIGPSGEVELAETLRRSELDEFPGDVRRVLERALADDPADRFETAARFVDAFCEALVGADDGGPSSDGFGPRSDITNPYVGLRPFDESKSGDFHGRERLIAELIDRLDPESRLIALVGASGSGKSSVVRAGLLPALRLGAVTGSEDWFISEFAPGAQPFEAIETALLRVAVDAPANLISILDSGHRGIVRAVRRVLPLDGELLLFIDQFEELFTMCEDVGTRQRFLDGLTAAVVDRDSPVHVVVTLRADFYDHPLRFPEFAELIKFNGVTVTPLTPDELRRAIEEPAKAVGVSFEPGLVTQIVADVSAQPGALPLAQYAVTELFESREGNVMTHSEYSELGGIAGALSQRAEGIYSSADSDQQATIEALFGRLITLGEGVEDTRRRVRRSELPATPHMDHVISRFTDARLLTLDRDTSTREQVIEVAHEALIREWPRLRTWLDNNRGQLRIQRHLTASALAWEQTGRDPGDLYRGGRLETAEDWSHSNAADLNAVEKAFLSESVSTRLARLEAEANAMAAKERQNRRLRRLLGSVAVVAAVAIIASVLALQQRRRADDEARAATETAAISESRRIGAVAGQMVQTEPRIALLLAAEAYRRTPGPESLGALQRALIGAGELLGYLGGGTRYTDVVWVDNNRLLAARTGAVELWTVEGEVLGTLNLDSVEDLVVSADGSMAAAALTGGVATWAVDDPDNTFNQITTAEQFQALTFSPDGSQLLGGRRDGWVSVFDPTDLSEELDGFSAHPETEVSQLDLGDAVSRVASHQPDFNRRGVLALGFNAAGTRLATGGWGYSRVWESGTWNLISSGPLIRKAGSERVVEDAGSVGFWTEQRREILVTVSRFTRVAHDVETGDQISYYGPENRQTPLNLRVEQISATLVADGLAVLSLSGREVEVAKDLEGGRSLNPHMSETTDVAITPDQLRIATSGDDGIAIASLVGDRLLGRAVPAGDSLFPNLNDDGQYLVLNAPIRGVAQRIWRFTDNDIEEVPIQAPQPDFVYPPQSTTALAWYCKGVCARALDAGTFRSLDVVTGRLGSPFDAPSQVAAASISASGELLLVADTVGRLSLFDLAARQLLAESDAFENSSQDTVRSASFDANEKTIAVSLEDGSAGLWDIERYEMEVLSEGGGSIVALGFHPNEPLLISGSISGDITFRDATTYQPTGQAFLTSSDALGGPGSPVIRNGIMVSNLGSQGRLWDIATQTQIGDPFPASPGNQGTASGDGRWLASVIDDWAVRWNVDVDTWPDIACRAAGRNLTLLEWEQLGPSDSPYFPTCPQYTDPSNTKES